MYVLLTFLSLMSAFSLNAFPSHKETYESIDAFANDFVKKHQLELLNKSGCGEGKNSLWGISVVSYELMTLEEGRKLANNLAYGLLYRMYHDPVFATYKKELGMKCHSPELIDSNISFRIAFWGKHCMNRPMPPYVAQIRLEKGNLYFHYADPTTKRLLEPIVESLESLNLPDYR